MEKLKEEAEANLFARCLLMPERQFLKYWKISKELSRDVVSDLSTLFAVEPKHIITRLKDFDL